MNVDLTWIRSEFPDLEGVTPLGRGGQKTVFSAEHGVHGACVVKLIENSTDPEVVARELLAVAEVASSRVPEVYEYGRKRSPGGDVLWIVEQRIDGISLRQRVRSSLLPPKEVVRLCLHGLEALARAEQVRIVHRDVKPDNMMRDISGNFWLLDFGLARHLNLTSLTATADAVGKQTFGYAPLEQVNNEKANIDGRADMFALAVTVYECATGRNVYRDGASDIFEIFRRLRTERIPDLVLPIPLAQEFNELLGMMGKRRRDHRPRSVQAALDWLRPIAAEVERS